MSPNTANTRIADDRIIDRNLSYELNGIFFDVHNALGRFRNEQQYSDALEEGIRQKHIGYEREKVLEVSFPGERMGRNRVDFLVENRIIIEVKAKIALDREDFGQVLRYLQSLNLKLGIIVNFGMKRLVPRRVINSSA